MSKAYQISSSDLERYVNSEIAINEKNPLSNWMSLQSALFGSLYLF
jgi:hypothetical protein